MMWIEKLPLFCWSWAFSIHYSWETSASREKTWLLENIKSLIIIVIIIIIIIIIITIITITIIITIIIISISIFVIILW